MHGGTAEVLSEWVVDMAEAKLRDPSDDSDLDAVAKAVKEKKLFIAGASLIYYCLIFLN
jgi:hypothetical protein